MFDSSHELLIFGISLAQWLDHLALPVHIHSEQRILENIAAFQGVFERYYPKGRILYAAKAQAAIPMLEVMASRGLGADVASLNELRAARLAGMVPERIGINGNAKEDDLIEAALHDGITLIADSLEEIALIRQMAQAQNKRAAILLRVSGFELLQSAEANVMTGGIWSKFGTLLSEVPECLDEIQRLPEIELIGFHMHLGSQMIDPSPYRTALGHLIACARGLIRRGGHVKILNLGGGFPVAYLQPDQWETLKSKLIRGFEALKRGDTTESHVFLDDRIAFDPRGVEEMQAQWTRNRPSPLYPKEKTLEAILRGTVSVEGETLGTPVALQSIGEPELHIEPGRSLIEDAGLTLTRVSSVKRIAGNHALVNLELGVSNHVDSLVERSIRHWQIANDPMRKDPAPFEAFVAGNLCFNGDILSHVKVPFQRRPIRGDIVTAFDTGAYCSNFLSSTSNAFPRPDQVLVKTSGEVVFLRKRDADHTIVRPKASGSRLF